MIFAGIVPRTCDVDYENWRVGLVWNHLNHALSVKMCYSHSESDDPRPNILNTYVDPVIGSGAPAFVPANALYNLHPDEYQSGPTRSFGDEQQ